MQTIIAFSLNQFFGWTVIHLYSSKLYLQCCVHFQKIELLPSGRCQAHAISSGHQASNRKHPFYTGRAAGDAKYASCNVWELGQYNRVVLPETKDVNVGFILGTARYWSTSPLTSTAADECATVAYDWNIDLTFFEVNGSGSATREGDATFLFILQRSCVWWTNNSLISIYLSWTYKNKGHLCI